MLGLQYFSFEELWSPMFFFFMAALVLLYFYIAGPWRLKHQSDAPPVTAGQKTWFVGGAILFYLAQGGPIDLLGHMMFSFHMASMSLSYLIVPPMMMLGVPVFMWRLLFGASFWKRLSLLMNPILTLLAFNVLFSVYHFPVVHDYVMTHFFVHRVYYVVLLISAFMMWWQIAGPVPEWNRLADVRKMAYIFANGLLLTPACALIIFAGAPMYATYNDPEIWAYAMGYCVGGDVSTLLSQFSGPTFFNLMGALEDQQTGGIIMKLVQEFMYGGILIYVFKQWYKREHADDVDTDDTGSGRLDPAGANT
ncbi:cytochrome c oxidase assembly factor CtaG [Paenibacillus methanolicus]|uniref:Putative membrane protein n=1 Tax=Paenibacillus methanolicus TaxID=582686 RepID=A0A5S5BTK8_9BACL|nr:cytochrome c oxidase assembly factor CtaG [Paenibacillus methanolicus]TYP70511.1 putative membrane protein [Paenibacillus methanolicus]